MISTTSSFTVDNHINSYLIGFSPLVAGSDLQVVGVRVRFTPPSTSEAIVVKSFSGINFYPSGSSLTFKPSMGGIYAVAYSAGRSFQVNLNLPSLARIKRITFYIKDNSGEKNYSLAGRLYSPWSGSYYDSVTGSTAGLDPSMTTRVITFNNTDDTIGDVNRFKSTFRLRAEPGIAGDNLVLVGAQVEYLSLDDLYMPYVIKQ
jgi:hypothetical protein